MIAISIVIPVLNGESQIRDCITSVINQDFQKDQYEIIVVDNGSKDNTINILTEYNENIIILHESRKGSYLARNTGINVSKGKIVAFIDSDCIADRNWLKELHNGFVSEISGDIGCIVGSVIPHHGKTLVEIYSKNKDLLSQKTTLDSNFLPYGQTANAAFRKEVFDIIGGFDEGFSSGGDADIAWRMQIETHYRLIYRPEAIVEHCHRTTFKGLFKQQFRYGFGRILLYRKYGDRMIQMTNTNESGENRNNVNKNIRFNLSKLTRLSLTMFIFWIRSFKRLFGFCDRYHMYEPLLSLLYISGYGLGKMYGLLKLRRSFFSTFTLN